MIYSEVYGRILDLFESGRYNDWVLTDPDTLQACRTVYDLDGTRIGFEFIELQETWEEELATFFEESYKITDYSVHELWRYGRTFYTDYEDFITLPLYQMFECLFENETYGDTVVAEEGYAKYVNTLNSPVPIVYCK